MTLIAISCVNSICRNLNVFQTFIFSLLVDDSDSSKSIVIKALRENLLNFLGLGIGGYVPIFWFLFKQKISHSSADNISFKPSCLNFVYNILHFFWYLHKCSLAYNRDMIQGYPP